MSGDYWHLKKTIPMVRRLTLLVLHMCVILSTSIGIESFFNPLFLLLCLCAIKVSSLVNMSEHASHWDKSLQVCIVEPQYRVRYHKHH
jgi:hypothetical protein